MKSIEVRRWFNTKLEDDPVTIMVPAPSAESVVARADPGSSYSQHYVISTTVGWAAEALKRELCLRYGIEYWENDDE